MNWLERYKQFIQQWWRTPYADYLFAQGKGTNCLRYGCAILDFLHGYNPNDLPPVPLLPAQTALHNRKKAIEVLRFIRRRYPGTLIFHEKQGQPAEDFPLQPADIICTNNGANPGHMLVVGPDPRFMEHCIRPNGVTRTAWGWCLGRGVYAILRPEGASTWT